MKLFKLFFISLLLCVGLMANAQESTDYDFKLDYDGTWWTWPKHNTSVSVIPYVGTDTDSTWYYTVLKESQDSVVYSVKVRTDSISGTAAIVSFYLQEKQLYSDTYSNIDTVTWSTGVDTTFYFTQSSPTRNRYVRTLAIGSADGFLWKILEYTTIFTHKK